MAWKWQAVWEG